MRWVDQKYGVRYNEFGSSLEANNTTEHGI